ncbi:DUF3429 domain-containing protein [Acidisoma cellulosilytica]|uniref:DUF3429 domain-containing protein n=1 Tax=Acidisoma cellulosilyticum TaxID=2802395 RepID=A0A963Z5B8_9PROT|nr:DUF3429 domain-containing protein [Acidisoma cellulosilyticum]MCB8882335.1 DUF3429 domain-containing protein [Acidisoma cellulosilyticum]
MRAPAPMVLLLGFLGLLPFFVTAYLASAWRSPSDAQAMTALLTYSAVILSFLGAVHWGFALTEPPQSLAGLAPLPRSQDPAHRPRLVLGVVPALIGWAALLIGFLVPAPAIALCVLIAGFLATNIAEHGAHRRGWVPGTYLWLRWILTVIVVALLVTVLVLRLSGARIIL